MGDGREGVGVKELLHPVRENQIETETEPGTHINQGEQQPSPEDR